MLDTIIMDTNLLDSQIKTLEDKINIASLPPDLKEKINTMLNLLKVSVKQGSNSMVSFESVSNYINWIASIPFNIETQDVLDLAHAKQVLDRNHYGLDPVKARILEYLASIILKIQTNKTDTVIRAPIICLVGLVGTGKTTLAYSMAQALGRNFERIPFGGMGDVRALRGQSRAFPDAEPGFIIKKLVSAKSRNCVILLDELDRVTDDARADIMGALVELLDPEQNKAFTDHYIDYPVDLSHVLFVATANNTGNIATAVLDRLEIIQMPSYTDEEKIVIAKQYLFPKILSATGISNKQLLVQDDVWPLIIRPLGFDSGIRSLDRTIEGIARKVARMIVEGKLPAGQAVTLNAQNVKDYLPI